MVSSQNRMKHEDILNALAALPSWHMEEGMLTREAQFSNFREAFSFMTRVAFEAEALNHHPDWSNVYNKVRFQLFTHEAGGITRLDFELATRIEALLRERGIR